MVLFFPQMVILKRGFRFFYCFRPDNRRSPLFPPAVVLSWLQPDRHIYSADANSRTAFSFFIPKFLPFLSSQLQSLEKCPLFILYKRLSAQEKIREASLYTIPDAASSPDKTTGPQQETEAIIVYFPEQDLPYGS